MIDYKPYIPIEERKRDNPRTEIKFKFTTFSLNSLELPNINNGTIYNIAKPVISVLEKDHKITKDYIDNVILGGNVDEATEFINEIIQKEEVNVKALTPLLIALNVANRYSSSIERFTENVNYNSIILSDKDISAEELEIANSIYLDDINMCVNTIKGIESSMKNSLANLYGYICMMDAYDDDARKSLMEEKIESSILDVCKSYEFVKASCDRFIKTLDDYIFLLIGVDNDFENI